MIEEKKTGQIVTREEGSKGIVLGDAKVLQTTGLNEEQIQELRMLHGRGMLDVHKKAQELQVDVQALNATLGTMATQTQAVSQAGDSVTMTHSHTSSLGRTEVIMGNTERAAKGKLTKSQTGEDDNTMKYIIIIAVVVIVIALLAFR